MMVALIVVGGVLVLVAVILFLALVPDLFGLDTPVCLDPGCACTGLAGDTTHASPEETQAPTKRAAGAGLKRSRRPRAGKGHPRFHQRSLG